ncbi:BREX system ATP-binding domain-containing protein [Petrocella sp. FN5]|uniref:BREX system ATP-binding domain-containing protein n=1 Tax=Petrocella sp. FN5 TaxID=3032002 RepID=UPI0023DA3B38|nr:BREX system ATP-binding domain-containing protein [Petrocella sp. FN5]MDF1618075.1 DUF2791 family P-loop domain-containing protein [Petrocella sp. FN5]
MKEVDKVLNALRMGVIPGTSIDDFMVGRDREKSELEDFMLSVEEGEGRVKFIRGAYGSGKTFMMKYLTEKALDQGFIIANVPIHSGFGFSKLEGVYANIMNHLLVRTEEETSTSFEMIFEKWIEGLKSSGDARKASQNIYNVIKALSDYNSSFSSVLLIYIRALISRDYELSTIAAAWIKGDKNIAYQLKRRLNVKGSVDGDNALDILSGFSKLIHLLGYKGLIITFDEAEIIMQQRVDTRLKAYTNIRQLMDSAGAGLLDYAGFVFAGTDEFFDDEEKGIKSYKALNQRIGSSVQGPSSLTNVRQPILQIQALNGEDYEALAIKMVELHSKSYAYEYVVNAMNIANLAKLEASKTIEGSTITVRIFLKKVLELLDLMLDNPNLPIFNAIKVSNKG